MDIRVLGPLEIAERRRVADIGDARLRRMCCALLLGGGDVVSL
jgi:hypothetical protein